MNMNVRADRDILLAEYTLGLLRGQETAQAHALLGEDPEAIVEALAWENRFLELTDLLARVDPSPLLLQRIQTTLGHDTTPALSSLYRKADNEVAREPAIPAKPSANTIKSVPAPRAVPPPAPRQRAEPTFAGSSEERIEPLSSTVEKAPAPENAPAPVKAAEPASATVARKPGRFGQGNIWAWRAATLLFAVIAIFLGVLPAQPSAPPVTVVELAPTHAAILQAPGQSSTPGWVVTIDPQRNVLMDPQVRSDIPADASVQLWTHNRNMPQPRSLGLIDPNKPVTVPATLIGDIAPDQIFEMTLEPSGGSPTASPTGPILFIGRLVTFGDPVALPAPGTAAQDPAS